MARSSDDEFDDRPRRKKAGQKKSKARGPSIGKILGIGLAVLLGLGTITRLVSLAIWAVKKNQPPAAAQIPVGDAPSDPLPQVQSGNVEEQKNTSRNNLKQLGLALHNYHDVYSMFPAAGVTQFDQTVNVSWQTSLLPFVGQANLYRQTNFNSAWNSPQNQEVFGRPIPTYLNPLFNDSGRPVSHYAGNSHIFQNDRWLGMRDVTDGLSNTILVGEVSAGLKPWADPTNIRDPALGLGKTPEQFGGTFQGGSHFLMGSGEVHFIADNIDPNVLKALATPNGGERVSPLF